MFEEIVVIKLIRTILRQSKHDDKQTKERHTIRKHNFPDRGN